MHKLKMDQGVNVFWYQDLQDLVEEVYGSELRLLDCISEYYAHQQSFMMVDVDGDSELTDIGDEAIVAKWIDTGKTEMLDMSDDPDFAYPGGHYQSVDLRHILHRLYNDNIITAGKYLMTINW